MIVPISQTLRLIHINLVLLRHGLDELIFATHLFRPLRFLLWLSPLHWWRKRKPLQPYPARVREALEDLGPIFIKFGQLLSTRRDLLPDDWADELARLQDRVPPFPSDVARRLIEKAWGCPIDAVLDDFSDLPLASASIAQVHTGRLKDGRDVIVKVLRPGIERIIDRDIALMYSIARLAHRYSKEARRLRPIEVVAEYEKTIYGELDLQREAANASQLRRNWLNSSALYIPDVCWDWTRPTVMVMERIYGTPVGDVAKLKAQGISMRLLGERGVEIFFTQVFRDNFFHADMHPGNIFVESSGRYISVDFGIVGSLTEEDQRYLAENLLAFFERNYRRVAELHVESGWVPRGTRVDEFESAIRTVSEPIFEKPLAEISFGHFLVRLFQTARRFNMEIQPQLVLLEKTLLNIEGLGRQLYPELDLWTTAKPFMERWMKERLGPRALLRRTRANFGPFAEHLPDLPMLAYRVLENMESNHLEARAMREEQARLQRELRERRTLVGVISGAVLIVCATLLVVLGPGGLLQPLVVQILAAAGFLIGVSLLIKQWRAAG
ncbi:MULTISPECIES: ubiquinone biosynthesis regulatory protein kinase UbiB [Thiorhodovibrio]|jgi:ubiquinone biosynthesis protein|uniref:ubiquinone biosynthesis regulatory protein kinase UbiB n=1 Tax=Thiorhodovibrio TaxID=61593 RepID=UPI0019116C4C|nr:MULTISPECIES: ubiquinone biosynthesis regulatory protein kinase UbiB [Thiorhodovibrio]MBK5968674.1 ubiquinone biosynthesis regulatory protein kinase UbiB [Thiorhodovibrio winogradskyi]WPL10968.1 putative ubiquinone biosynthesis protein UbiB [Thiorhodovibrio litoralis]